MSPTNVAVALVRVAVDTLACYINAIDFGVDSVLQAGRSACTAHSLNPFSLATRSHTMLGARLRVAPIAFVVIVSTMNPDIALERYI